MKEREAAEIRQKAELLAQQVRFNSQIAVF